MKKIAVAGLFAIGLIALSQQHASAWVNARFSIGLNWNYQSGGNQVLWGAWTNGQPPGPEAFGRGHHGNVPSFAPSTHHHHHGSSPQYYAPMPQVAPTGSSDHAPMYASPYAGTYQQSSSFQFASYARQTYYYPTYYYYYYPATYYYGW